MTDPILSSSQFSVAALRAALMTPLRNVPSVILMTLQSMLRCSYTTHMQYCVCFLVNSNLKVAKVFKLSKQSMNQVLPTCRQCTICSKLEMDNQHCVFNTFSCTPCSVKTCLCYTTSKFVSVCIGNFFLLHSS